MFKGDFLSVVCFVGFVGSKCIVDLIFLCYLILVMSVEVDVMLKDVGIYIIVFVKIIVFIGVEMEVFIVVMVVVFNVYDMFKVMSKVIEVSGVWLLFKIGGKSGDY